MSEKEKEAIDKDQLREALDNLISESKKAEVPIGVEKAIKRVAKTCNECWIDL